MLLRYTVSRVLVASGLSLLFILQAFAAAGSGNRAAVFVRGAFALLMTACCFWMVLSYKSDRQLAAEGKGTLRELRWRRWRLVLWFVFIVLIANLITYWRSSR